MHHRIGDSRMNRTSLFDFDPNTAWDEYEPDGDNRWTVEKAAHLYRRAGFGGTVREIKLAQEIGPSKAIDRLFDFSKADDFEKEMGETGRLIAGRSDTRGLSAWWLLRMAKTPVPLQEKLTLFWHGHFATGAEKVMDGRAMLRQNNMLRRLAFSKFESMVTEISRDVAMLIYLDSTENRKTRPNENYARELLELFCLGPGNYSEDDIKQIARAFTGWEVRRGKFKFNTYQHDTGSKSFLGNEGKYDGNDAIGIVLQQKAASRFIARKLIRFFVMDDLPESNELIDPIAKQLRENDFEIGPVVRTLLSSNLFFSKMAIGKKIKSPVELAVGVIRFFDFSVNMQTLTERLGKLGQLPFYPPSVKGWDGGRTWINASSILGRANLINQISKSNNNVSKLKTWHQTNKEHVSGSQAKWIQEYLMAESLPSNAITILESNVESMFNDNPQKMLAFLAALPEFQLN